MTRRLCPAGLDLIKSFEGCKLEAYVCPAGVATIGYGRTKGVVLGQRITQEQADELLQEDLAEAEAAVERLVTVPLTDNQHGALVSLVFNIGVGAFKRSTLLVKLNAGDYGSVPGQIMRWDKAGGKRSRGLIRRRAAEAALWVGD
jgi:lysozyme